MYSTTGIDPSNFVSTFNRSFYFIVGIAVILLVGITILMLYFVYRYNKKRHKEAVQIQGNTTLEIIWTVIPVILALAMFYYGWMGWRPMNKAPKNAISITSVARMWNFNFEYDNGIQSPDLVIPVNTPVKINLVSLDVIHSLFIPAFRIKSDMVPGREKMMWFLPQNVGEFDLFCAEYCGLRHSYMNAKVKVLSQSDFKKWYSDSTKSVSAPIAEATPGAEGLAIMRTQGCNACHSTDGTKIVGPSYLNLYDSKVVVERDGKEVTVTADDDYIRRSIYEPNADIVKGYPRGLMQSYKSTLTDDDINKIIEYLKTLHDK
jgi:cytochrome c oxidase subunit 2